MKRSWTATNPGRALLFLWELPQNVMGALFLAAQLALGGVRSLCFERERLFIELRGDSAVSLGLFVFWISHESRDIPVGPENRAHEYGHSIQSRWLGPLYLPIVGVPSVSRVLYAIAYHRIHGRRWTGYYDGFPEDWADRLGGVVDRSTPTPSRGRAP